MVYAIYICTSADDVSRLLGTADLERANHAYRASHYMQASDSRVFMRTTLLSRPGTDTKLESVRVLCAGDFWTHDAMTSMLWHYMTHTFPERAHTFPNIYHGFPNISRAFPKTYHTLLDIHAMAQQNRRSRFRWLLGALTTCLEQGNRRMTFEAPPEPFVE